MLESESIILLPGRKPDELQLTLGGSIVKHLGVQMYAGRPVPAIAELISNSWDADARTVEVRVPLDEPWETDNEKHVIEVSDDGRGMTWDNVKDAYLDVGRDRREEERTDHSPSGRQLQGRKGVGKLAGFGIADVVEVQTVHDNLDPELKEKILIWFKMSLTKLEKAKGRAPVEIVYAGPVSKAPEGERREKGTTITLRQLRQRRAINKERFHWSMAQRFLLIGPNFRVTINGEDLKKEDIKLQWRWPKEGWIDDEVEGCGPVKYWIGFTENPRRQSEGEQSGLLIYTRGKVAQESTFFDISGGVTGQHGLRYMVGQVKAEWLDEGKEDLIATHRATIAWESPKGAALQKWGQEIVKKYLTEWVKNRVELRERHIMELHPMMRGRIESLAPSYRQVALKFHDKFKTIEMEPKDFEEIFSWFLDALENATLREILKKLREADTKDLEQLNDLLSRMEVRIAVTLLQIIESNLAAIETLEKMHLTDARERGVIAKHIERNPWLIHPTWMLNTAEGRVSTWIRKEFGLEPTGDKGDEDRVDFFCVGVGGTLHIVEIKRGAYVATEEDFLQADRYRTYVLKRFEQISDKEAITYKEVRSHLIAAELHTNAESIKEAFEDKGWVIFTTWDDLIERAKRSHHQFREAFKKISEEVDLSAA
jgi:hypothetical protein